MSVSVLRRAQSHLIELCCSMWATKRLWRTWTGTVLSSTMSTTSWRTTGTTTVVETCPDTLRSSWTSTPTCESQFHHHSKTQKYSYLKINLICINLPPRLPYNEFFGGVSGLMVKQFKKINGFPNAFWGWGGEDDDLWNRYRVEWDGLTLSHWPVWQSCSMRLTVLLTLGVL